MNRKEQERKLSRHRIENNLSDMIGPNEIDGNGMLALNSRIFPDNSGNQSNNDAIFKKFMIKRSTSQYTLSPFNFSEESVTSFDVGILVICESIMEFDKFLEKYTQIYNSVKI
jgi:hypothetical protein